VDEIFVPELAASSVYVEETSLTGLEEDCEGCGCGVGCGWFGCGWFGCGWFGVPAVPLLNGCHVPLVQIISPPLSG
jgi:hypothetical protein